MKFSNVFDAKVRQRAEDDEEDMIYGLRMYNKPKIVNEVDAYLDEPIYSPAYYRNLLQYMRQMEEGDSLRIWIDSPGGQLDSTLAIVDSMNNSEGNIICIVSGRAYSAASMIALCAPQLIVTDTASMMIHNANYGVVGKVHEVHSRVDFNTKNLRDIIQKCYEGFLTSEEIERTIEGKDYWFDKEEILRRLEIRQQLIEAAQKATVDAEKAPLADANIAQKKTRVRKVKENS